MLLFRSHCFGKPCSVIGELHRPEPEQSHGVQLRDATACWSGKLARLELKLMVSRLLAQLPDLRWPTVPRCRCAPPA